MDESAEELLIKKLEGINWEVKYGELYPIDTVKGILDEPPDIYINTYGILYYRETSMWKKLLYNNKIQEWAKNKINRELKKMIENREREQELSTLNKLTDKILTKGEKNE